MVGGILSSRFPAVNETAGERGDRVTMGAMAAEHAPEPSQFRVTLFVGPQPVEGRPGRSSCVFNVKKRSWKGGVQVAVHMAQGQIDRLSAEMDFAGWLAQVLRDLSAEDRASCQERASELFIQAVCWCKLDILLQSGIMQENQCLAADSWIVEVGAAVLQRRSFVRSYVAAELDLAPGEPDAS